MSCGKPRRNATANSRPWHLLRSVKGLSVPSRVVTFVVLPEVREVATNEYEHTFAAACASCSWLSGGQVMDRRHLVCRRPAEFFDFVRAVQIKDRCTWIFAHGLAYQLTLLGFWDTLNCGGETYLWGVLEDPPTIVCTRRGRRVLKYVDTRNYWRVQLSELMMGGCGAESVKNRAPQSFTDQTELARRQVNCLEDLICTMIWRVTSEKMCGWQCTAASMSWASYRHSFLQQPIWVHGHKEATRLERDGLFGGLLSTARIGLVPTSVTAVDCNSLYPYVMANEQHPNKLVSYDEEVSITELRQALQGYWCVAEVTCESPPYPLPFRNANLVGTSQARGCYTLCGRELEDVARDGICFSCLRLSRYNMADLFSSFVSAFYPRKVEAKRSGNVADYHLYKMLLNGLSGKFAQRKRGWQDDKKILAPDRWGYWWAITGAAHSLVRCRAVAGRTQRLDEPCEKRDSLPAVTASITAAGRRQLRAFADLSGPDAVIYTDTDCLHVTDAGYTALSRSGAMDETRLGALKVVARGHDAYYWGPKHYRVGDYWVSNVVQLGARPLQDGVWLQDARAGLAVTLNSDSRDRVYVKSREVTVSTGQGSYRPISKAIGGNTRNGQNQ